MLELMYLNRRGCCLFELPYRSTILRDCLFIKRMLEMIVTKSFLFIEKRVLILSMYSCFYVFMSNFYATF